MLFSIKRACITAALSFALLSCMTFGMVRKLMSEYENIDRKKKLYYPRELIGGSVRLLFLFLVIVHPYTGR